MQQVFVIHGGNAFDRYDDFLKDLKAKEVTLEGLTAKDWKTELTRNLGEDYQVLNPRMPNAQNAKYSEWKIYFEKLVSLMKDEVILVGHSLGAVFLTKFLSENRISNHIRATLLISAPFNTATQHPMADFNLGDDFTKLVEQGGDIFFFHSQEDEIVPYSDMLSYRTAIPSAVYLTFDGRGHFNEPSFPELEETIRELNVK